MMQEVARRHQKEAVKWALDDIVYHTEVTHYDKVDSVKAPPVEGCYIHGLSLEGAGWSKDQTALTESEPKVLFVPLPILLASACLKSDEAKSRKEMYGSQGPYDCPCYKYRSRTDRCVSTHMHLLPFASIILFYYTTNLFYDLLLKMFNFILKFASSLFFMQVLCFHGDLKV